VEGERILTPLTLTIDAVDGIPLLAIAGASCVAAIHCPEKAVAAEEVITCPNHTISHYFPVKDEAAVPFSLTLTPTQP